MNAVLGLTGSLLESNLDADQRKAAEAIQEASDGLLSILNDILDLSKLDTGKLEFEAGAVLDRIRHRQHQEHRGAARGRKRAEALARRRTGPAQGADRRSEPRPPDPAQPRQQCGQVHAGRARSSISARCVERDADQRDGAHRGQGFRHRHRVRTGSDACSRISSRPTPRSIASMAAPGSASRSASGWSIRWAARSRSNPTLGSGSTFAFQVSLTLADLADLEQRGAARTTAPDSSEMLARLGRPLRVLIAEDNATNQLVVTRMLREFDIDLRIAQNGVEARGAGDAGRLRRRSSWTCACPRWTGWRRRARSARMAARSPPFRSSR